MLSLGNSEGTKGKDVSGEIIMVKSMEEYNNLPAEKVKDKILFFNYPFNQSFIETFKGYGDAAKYRTTAASLTAKKEESLRLSVPFLQRSMIFHTRELCVMKTTYRKYRL